MLKIGEFSKLSHVSVRMLRHYDEIGLLHPQRVDPITGYRLYGEEQLFTAGKINVYRGMGFGLTAIAGLLHEADPQKLRAMLERQQDYHDTEHVRFKTEPAVCVASAIHYGSYETIIDASAAVAAWVEKNGYQMCGVMFNVYHVSPHETQNPDELVTEVCIPVKRRDSAE